MACCAVADCGRLECRVCRLGRALDDDQARRAYAIGLERSAAARARGGVHWFPWDSDDQQKHFDGMSAVAECWVAAALGREWTSQGMTPDAPTAGDVDGGISVRWTRHAAGSLIVKAHDPDSLRAVLVVGPKYPSLRMAGWIAVADAKLPKYWRPDLARPVFFVPQSALRRDVQALRATAVGRFRY